MAMAVEQLNRARLTAADHPENRAPETRLDQPVEFIAGRRPIGIGRAVMGVCLGGFVGSLLTILTVANPLGAGDKTAALSMLPLALVLITIVNAWMAVNLFLDSGIRKRNRKV